MYSKKAVTGAFLALAITAAATGTVAHASNNNVTLHAETEANVGFQRSFGRLVDNLRADVKLHAEKKRHTDDRKDHSDRAAIKLAVVTDVDGDTIYADSYYGGEKTAWTIMTDGNTKFSVRGDKSHDDLAAITAGARITVTGNATDNDGTDRIIDASSIVRWNDNHAMAQGTVTRVDEDNGTFVLDTKHQGDVTVDMNADTEVRAGNDEGTLADIAVGTKLFVKGMWDSVTEAFVAAKVRILG